METFDQADPLNELAGSGQLSNEIFQKGLFNMPQAQGLARMMATPGMDKFGGAMLQMMMPQQGDGFTLSPGQTRYDASGRPVAFGRNSSTKEDLFAKINPSDYTPQSVALFQKTGDYSSLSPVTDRGEADKKDNEKFQRENTLRDEFSKGASEFVKVSDAYGRIQASVTDPSAAGDMALIFNYMKMLDPGSTVREGEYATAQNATGVPGQVQSMYNRLLSGERLNPGQRKDFESRSDKLYGSQLKGLEQLEGQYKGLAERYQVNPSNVIVDYRVKRDTPKKRYKYNPATGQLE